MEFKHKNILFVLCTIILFLLLTVEGIFSQRRTADEDARAMVNELREFIQQKKEQGCDVSKAVEAGKRAREAFITGDREKGNHLLDEAYKSAGECAPKHKAESLVNTDAGVSQVQRKPRKSKTIELPIKADKALYKIAVPNPEYEKGIQIKNFDASFESNTLKVTDGKLLLQLDERPVFLEVSSGSKASARSNDKDSPFGIHDPKKYSSEMNDIGVKWVRLAGSDGLIWALIEPRKGEFDFSKMDKLIQQYYGKGINLLVNVNCFNFWDQYGPGTKPDPKKRISKLPKDLEAYSNFLQMAVERYDGDGIDDAPGSPVVGYWQILNEVDSSHFWQDSAENYAKLLKASYKAIKKANKDTKVVMSGFATPTGFYQNGVKILKELDRMRDNPNDLFFDVFDFHWSGQWGGDYKKLNTPSDNVDLSKFVDDIMNRLSSYGYKNTPIWITEMSGYSGSPATRREPRLPLHSEEDHAVDMVKRYVYSLTSGVKKIFWVSLEEWHNFGGMGGGYFDSVGLINNPQNHGESHKKLAYYSYKLMVEKLEGSDWDKIERLSISPDVFACRFKKGDKYIYVLWHD